MAKLKDELADMRAEVVGLRQERDYARRTVCRLLAVMSTGQAMVQGKSGRTQQSFAKRLGWDCFLNADPADGNAAEEIKTLRGERDEARREVCRFEASAKVDSWDDDVWEAEMKAEAKRRGWDVFKEDTDG